jgi:mannose-6-phosphate isomerase-like protein (cupin superfamily)
MEPRDAHSVARGLVESGELWAEVFRSGNLSCGIYCLAAGSEDPQAPHHEDEIYVVVEGRARLWVEGELMEASPGVVLFVAAEAEHRFVDVTEDLVVVVVFAPPEST